MNELQKTKAPIIGVRYPVFITLKKFACIRVYSRAFAVPVRALERNRDLEIATCPAHNAEVAISSAVRPVALQKVPFNFLPTQNTPSRTTSTTKVAQCDQSGMRFSSGLGSGSASISLISSGS